MTTAVAADVTVRELATQAEYAACVELQRETWGRDFRETVPPSLMLVSQKLGGVAAGAFDRSGGLLGFVFGITGVQDGAIVHWSDMLAVRPEAQNSGIGRRLKEYQRVAVGRAGARAVLWTYDPLVARNAHLNLNVHGVSIDEYVPNMYGTATGSRLHGGLGTDRLVARWAVNDMSLSERRALIAAVRTDDSFREASVIGDVDRPDPRAEMSLGELNRLRIAIPYDIGALMHADPVRAAEWREANRGAFQRALAMGFVVHGFRIERGGERDRGYYLLGR